MIDLKHFNGETIFYFQSFSEIPNDRTIWQKCFVVTEKLDDLKYQQLMRALTILGKDLDDVYVLVSPLYPYQDSVIKYFPDRIMYEL